MTVTTKQPNKLVKIFSVSLLSFTCLMTVTACDNTPSNTPSNTPLNTPKDSATATNSATSQNTENSTANAVAEQPALPVKDTTLASTTLNTLLQATSIPLTASGILNTKKQQCLDNITIDFALDEVQAYFEEHLTPEELDELNALYKSESAIVYTQYGRDQLLVSSGLPMATITQKPADEHMNKMKEFSKSKLGKKYIKLTKKKGDDSLTALVMPLLIAELKKCGIEAEDEGK